jgi:hypothetical protein
MQKKYPALQKPDALEAYKRKWRYMFAYAESGYANAYTALNIWTFARPVCYFTPISCKSMKQLKFTISQCNPVAQGD